ncbi:MAG TPA: DJ-1/PfpI family protein, partial [Acidimicrobiales bacterium]|nr:DJ-1/PfpI family protein [Acidimicrobiales bacterium]
MSTPDWSPLAETDHELLFDIILFDGVDELDVIGPLEVFRRAAALGAELTSRLATLAPLSTARGAFGLSFRGDALFVPGQASVVVVPGGGWVARSPAGAWVEANRGEWPRVLAEAWKEGSVLAGVCTGALLLAHAGIIGSRRATTHHDALADLVALGATTVHERVVDEGQLLTCGGVTSGIDLALWLVQRYFGEDLGTLVGEGLEYKWSRPEEPAVAPLSTRAALVSATVPLSA